jgi:hypothetical protein
MLHFTCLQKEWHAPEALYHHCRELWDLVKSLTFPDGRILRIGGDSRVRNAYCQDYTGRLGQQDAGADRIEVKHTWHDEYHGA